MTKATKANGNTNTFVILFIPWFIIMQRREMDQQEKSTNSTGNFRVRARRTSGARTSEHKPRQKKGNVNRSKML
jgi:hypothetical protein